MIYQHRARPVKGGQKGRLLEMTIKERAYKIDTFATYLESCGITKDEEIKSAARYQFDCICMGDENGRWCDAPEKDKRLLREFVRKYC